jgi:hypothetical protein
MVWRREQCVRIIGFCEHALKVSVLLGRGALSLGVRCRMFSDMVVVLSWRVEMCNQHFNPSRMETSRKVSSFCQELAHNSVVVLSTGKNNQQSQHSSCTDCIVWQVSAHVRSLHRARNPKEKLPCKTPCLFYNILWSCWELNIHIIENIWWAETINYRMCL